MHTTVGTTINILPKINRHLFNAAFSTFFLIFPPKLLLCGSSKFALDQDRPDSYSFNLLGSAYGFLSHTNKNLQNAY